MTTLGTSSRETKTGVRCASSAVLGLALWGCGAPDPVLSENTGVAEEEIVNGQIVAANTLPWQVRIRRFVPATMNPPVPAQDFTNWCGGSILHPNWVVTAGHCVRLGNGTDIQDQLTVIAGDHTVNTAETTEQIRTVQNVTFSPNFVRAGLRSDIVLLRLNQALTIQHGVQTIALPTAVPAFGTVSGWGMTETGMNSNVLRSGTISVQTPATCNNDPDIFNLFNRNLDANELCAVGAWVDGRVIDSCNGDSGGPFYHPGTGNERRILDGLVSWGAVDCRGPGVYVRVLSHLNFITTTMAPDVNRGNVRMTWSGNPGGMSTIRLLCWNSGETAESSMVARGVEPSFQCQNSWVLSQCTINASGRSIAGYTRRVNGGGATSVSHDGQSGGEWFFVDGATTVDYDCNVTD